MYLNKSNVGVTVIVAPFFKSLFAVMVFSTAPLDVRVEPASVPEQSTIRYPEKDGHVSDKKYAYQDIHDADGFFGSDTLLDPVE